MKMEGEEMISIQKLNNGVETGLLLTAIWSYVCNKAVNTSDNSTLACANSVNSLR